MKDIYTYHQKLKRVGIATSSLIALANHKSEAQNQCQVNRLTSQRGINNPLSVHY